MKVTFNNEPREYDTGTILAVLVEEFRATANVSRVGVWVNQKMIRQPAYEKTILQEGDRISIRKVASGG